MTTILLHLCDWLSDRLELYALPEPMRYAWDDNEVTLKVPGYNQTNSYACGAMAGLMVLKTFRPKAPVKRFYRKVNPHPTYGTGINKLARALRAHHIGVGVKRNLTFARLTRAIDAGYPVIVSIHNTGAEFGHWAVVYGYRRKPDAVFLAVNGPPLFNRKIIARKEFERIWTPPATAWSAGESN